MSVQVDPGSFRDPSGHVYHLQDRVYRTINPAAAAHYETARDSGCLAALVERGLLIASQEVDKAVLGAQGAGATRSEEHTSELQSLMRISYAVFCLKKKITKYDKQTDTKRVMN